jgi:hypothetical protein
MVMMIIIFVIIIIIVVKGYPLFRLTPFGWV